MLKPRTDLGAASDGAPGRVRPLDFRLGCILFFWETRLNRAVIDFRLKFASCPFLKSGKTSDKFK